MNSINVITNKFSWSNVVTFCKKLCVLMVWKKCLDASMATVFSKEVLFRKLSSYLCLSEILDFINAKFSIRKKGTGEIMVNH